MSPQIRSFLSQILGKDFAHLLQVYEEKKFGFDKRNKEAVFIHNKC